MKKLAALVLVVSAPASGTSIVFSPVTVQVPARAPAPPLPTTGVMQVWRSAPLTDGGYARCIKPGGCHAFYSQDIIIANYDTVWMYSWVGVSSGTGGLEQRQIGGFWPQGNFKEAGLGREGLVEEWEGVN